MSLTTGKLVPGLAKAMERKQICVQFVDNICRLKKNQRIILQQIKNSQVVTTFKF